MPKRNKVLMLVENLSVPADPRVWREAQALHDFGYDVSVICPQGEDRDLELYTCIDDIHIYRYPLSMTINKSTDYIKEYVTAMLNTLGLTFKVWKRHGFDVIHAANPPDTFFAIGLLYRLLGKKFVFDQHDLSPELFHVRFKDRMKSLYKLLLFFEWCSYQTANIVITTNESQKRNAIERGHCRPEKVFVVRNGPDLNRLVPGEPEPELKKGRRYLLAYVGVMGLQDGVDYTLRALHELVHKRGRQDVSLVLMGDGDQLPTLQALAHELDLDDYVNFTGWVAKNDLVRYLTVTDVGLCPDPRNELNDYCTMLKAMEYMAISKPIVAFDLLETRYSAQEAALYAEPNLVEDFADKIEILLDDEDLRCKMGAFGRKRVEDELAWSRTREKLRLAYQKLFHITPEPAAKPSEPETEQPAPDSVSVPVGH